MKMHGGRDRSVGRLFNAAADVYATARPRYPGQIYELLQAECGLEPGSEVLEIGAGAGQATADLIAKGARITAVEPGSGFIPHLRELDPGLRVVPSTFEEADLPQSKFDLVVSATAFHWIDPNVGVPKLAFILKDGGSLAVWATLYGDSDRQDPFHQALEPILEEHAPELIPPPGALNSSAPRGTREWISVVESSGQFDLVQTETIKWEGHHDAHGLRQLFATFSPWLALPPEKRDLMLDHVERLARDQFTNHVVRPYRTVIHWTRKQAGRKSSRERNSS